MERPMKQDYEVHFKIEGCLKLSADTEERARQVANLILDNRLDELGGNGMTVFVPSDDDFTTDVRQLGGE